jgi:hypothetical protein
MQIEEPIAADTDDEAGKRLPSIRRLGPMHHQNVPYLRKAVVGKRWHSRECLSQYLPCGKYNVSQAPVRRAPSMICTHPLVPFLANMQIQRMRAGR